MPRLSDASPPIQPRAGVIASYVDGWRRVWRAPAIVVGAWAVALLVTALLTTAAPDPSDTAAFASLASSAADAFTYETLELAGVLVDSPESTAVRLPPGVAGRTAGYLLLWIFLSGGILDRLARGRPVGSGAFFSACGVHFFRFLRLGVIVGAAYWALLWGLAANRADGTLLGWAVAGVLVGFVMMTADFAKARAVVEDRRSMAGALLASLRFIRRRPLRVAGLLGLHVIALAGMAYVWSLWPPAESIWPSLLLTSMYLLPRLVLRLALMGAQIAFFQGELAHATYTAAPLPVWPDSPSAEAIENFLRRRDS